MSGQAADPQFQGRIDALQEQKKRWLEQDVATLLQHPWGRRLAYHIVFELGRLEAPSYDTDPVVMARNEGIREMASAFKHLLFVSNSDNYMLMLKEQIEAQQAALAVQISAELHHQREGKHDDEF
jgi:hypothetical protein